MIKHIHAFNDIQQRFVIFGVGTVGIGVRWAWRQRNLLVFIKQPAILIEEVFPLFQLNDLRGGDAGRQQVFVDPPAFRLFSEKETRTGYTVADGEGRHGDFGRLIDDLLYARLPFIELNGEIKGGVGVFELEGKDVAQAGRSIQIEAVFSAIEVHRGYETDEPIIMVAMQMADENIVDFGEPYVIILYLQLGAFPTVDQVVGVVHRQYLCCLIPPVSRGSRIRTQNF